MYVVAEQPGVVGVVEGSLEDPGGDRILGAEVDVAFRRAGGEAGNGHAFDQAVWIAFHEYPVRECAGVALVGVADDVLLLAGRIEHGSPLDVGWKPGAAPAA